MRKLNQNKKHAFTLVEIMVAISIFAIIALIVVQAFITADRVNKKAQAMKTVIDNLHFALNTISFNLQQGGTYHCLTSVPSLPPPDPIAGLNCRNGGNAIVFRSPKSGDTKTISYKLGDCNGDGKNEICYWKTGMPDFTPITMKNLEINTMKFYVSNSESGDGRVMPRVFFTVSGKAKLGKDVATEFQLQTVVSERI